MTDAAALSVQDTVDPAAPLPLTRRVTGPWLAIRAGTPAEAASIVLACDPAASATYRRVDVGAPIMVGRIADATLIPLSDFGVSCTLYSASRVLSVWRSGLSRARRSDGTPWAWEGARIERIKIDRAPATIELLRDAVRDCNTLGRLRP